MKVANSLRSLKQRHRDCRVVRRKGRVYVINRGRFGNEAALSVWRPIPPHPPSPPTRRGYRFS